MSIFSNVTLMKILVSNGGMKVLPANLVSIAITAVANFLLGKYFVFRPGAGGPAPGSQH